MLQNVAMLVTGGLSSNRKFMDLYSTLALASELGLSNDHFPDVSILMHGLGAVLAVVGFPHRSLIIHEEEKRDAIRC